ncbi:MAG: mandelate racemase/muconate lactonizing enzyme family protein [Planctomycetes bacterium]|jgi:L-alanine-DL-glutamate epimerase-like enolase superfamily enzyme|nr:mandelate racemase/muconate lactonizing enzyme family protein [Planctomycetota bacterium]
MRTNRRQFLATALAGSVTAGTSWPLSYGSQAPSADAAGALNARYPVLDKILQQPVLKRELFKTPVIIESLELLRYEGSFLCRVRSKDGAEGISVGHSSLRSLYPIFVHALQPFFLGKDARDLDRLMEKVLIYSFNFRLSGMALGIPLATIEFALLDLLGRIAGQPLGRLIGDIRHPEVAVYQATEYREKSVEESLELIKRDVAEYNAHALKIKVGGLMFMTKDIDAVGPAGRTETIIPLIRKTFGDDMALYADANGFYSAPEAIRVGRLLEEYRYGFFEEPVMFDWYEETKQVADALTMPVAGGEQEYSLHGFRWLIAHDGLQIVQPDNYYFGGMIRSMQVARMAQAFGKTCTPHMSGGGLGYLYMIHFVSALPNACAHHEFKGLRTSVRFECQTSPLSVTDGKIKVPTGPGLGVDIDADYLRRHQPVKA